MCHWFYYNYDISSSLSAGSEVISVERGSIHILNLVLFVKDIHVSGYQEYV